MLGNIDTAVPQQPLLPNDREQTTAVISFHYPLLTTTTTQCFWIKLPVHNVSPKVLRGLWCDVSSPRPTALLHMLSTTTVRIGYGLPKHSCGLSCPQNQGLPLVEHVELLILAVSA